MKKLLPLIVAVLLAPLAAAQTGYVTVSASHVVDASGAPLASGTITFTPVNNSGQSISFLAGGSQGGQTITRPVSARIINGMFSVSLADTNLTQPKNVCYSAQVADSRSGATVLQSGYSCVQPAYNTTSPDAWCVNGSCDFDLYIPNEAALSVTGNGVQSFNGRAGAISLIASDIPAINLASSSNGGVMGTLPAANGGTGGLSIAYCAIPNVKCDGVILSDGAMTSGSAVLIDASGRYGAGDVGKTAIVNGAGASGAALYSTISAYTSATQVTLASPASTTVSAAQVTYGTDDAPAFQAYLAAQEGTSVYVTGTAGKTSLWDSAIVLPNSGSGVGSYTQSSVVINGLCAANFFDGQIPAGCFTIDMTANVTPKLATYGGGVFGINNTVFEDTSTDCVGYWFYTTNTELLVDRNYFSASGPGGTSSCAKLFLLGGTSTTDGMTTNSAFAGYGTEFISNAFHKFRHTIDAQTFANGIVVNRNKWANDNGSSAANDALINDMGATVNGGNQAWQVNDNLVEATNIVYFMQLTNAPFNKMVGNSGFDAGGSFKAMFHFNANSDYNEFSCLLAYPCSDDTDNPNTYNVDLTPNGWIGGDPTFGRGLTIPNNQGIGYGASNYVYVSGSNLIYQSNGTNTAVLGGGAFNFINGLRLCDPAAFGGCSFSSLPGGPSEEGRIQEINDSPSSVPGTVITSGGGSNKAVVFFNGTNWIVAAAASTVYSAAGTPLPTCGAGIQGEKAVVKDATSPTYMGTYTSGGGITAAVICSYNGTTYAWLTH